MNSMQMPQQAPAQSAGLGAMIKAKGGDGAGAPKQTMDQMMALAEKMPDSELADVLAGKSMRVPQFAAMLAAMGRDSLRTAVAGAQAGQAKEPNKKDQMLAKMAGINALPAENMETVSAAEGGIIGFSGTNGSVVTDPQTQADRAALLATGRYVLDAVGNIVEAPFKGLGTASDFLINRPLRAMGVPIPRVPSQFRYGAEEPKAPTAGETIGPQVTAFKPQADEKAGATPPPKTGADQTGGAPRGTAPGTAPGIAPPAVAAPEQRKSFLDGLDEGADDNAKRMAEGKSQAQGEFLMQLGASLLGTPNLGQALQQGVQKGLPGLAASRKETNAILKEQREYRLNMAKAKEAAAQGNDDLAFKYAKLAEDSKYQAGMVGAAMARGGANDTRISTAAMNKAQEQLKLAMGDPRQKRNLGTVEAQQAFLNNAFQSNLSILSGQGPITPRIPTYGEIPQGATIRE
jgi:hypothetical protein